MELSVFVDESGDFGEYDYSFDITEMTASGSIVHVYRRK